MGGFVMPKREQKGEKNEGGKLTSPRHGKQQRATSFHNMIEKERGGGGAGGNSN